MWRRIELRIDVVTRPACACAGGAATLNHEAIDDSVENQAIVKSGASQSDHILAMIRGDFGEQVQLDRALAGFEFDLVVVFLEVDIGDRSINFRFVRHKISF